jgi:hypothetical protein
MIGKSCFEGAKIEILHAPSGKLSLRRIVDEAEMMELEAIAIDGMQIVLDDIESTCTIIKSETAILPANLKYQGRNYEVKSISDSVIGDLSSAAIGLPRFVRAITGTLLASPFANMLDLIPIRNLVVVTLPEWIEKTTNSAFSKCDSLREVVFPSAGALREINGFDECSSLQMIEIPISVETICGFSKCESLSSVIFRSGGKLREVVGFNDCPSLTRIEIPSSVEKMSGFSSLTWECDDVEFRELSSLYCGLTEVRFVENGALKEIEGFNGCEFLKRIVIPGSVERISGFNSILVKDSLDADWEAWIEDHDGDDSFVRRCGISEVTFELPSALREIEGFNGCVELRGIDIPERVEKISGFHSICWGSLDLSSWIRVSQGLIDIKLAQDGHLREVYAFDGCRRLVTLDIPASVETLHAFCAVCGDEFDQYDSSLKAVIIASPNKLKRLRGFDQLHTQKVFGLVASVEEVAWADGCLSIKKGISDLEQLISGCLCGDLRGVSMFHYFPLLERIDIPAFVRVIKKMDFYMCRSLREIVIAADSELHKIAGFNECWSIEHIHIGGSVEILSGLNGSVSLRDVVFEVENDLKDVRGFVGCKSIKIIENAPRCWRISPYRAFVTYVEDFMICGRRHLHVMMDGRGQDDL